MSDEGAGDAERLRRIREAVRARSLLEAPPTPPARETKQAPPLEPLTAPSPETPAPRPDAAELNVRWDMRGIPAQSLPRRLLRRLIAPLIDAQTTFNARQVQFDNELLEYLEARLASTHRYYDGVLGAQGKRLEDVDERHLILQEELVQHVHDLVKRSDLVLAESEKGRLALEFALRELRQRLERLEAKLERG